MRMAAFLSAVVFALVFVAAIPAAEAKSARHGMAMKGGGHDRGLHRGWSHSNHWGARRAVPRGRVMMRR